MFENRTQPVISRTKFFWRLLSSFLIGCFFIIIGLLIGMVGYHLTENMTWVDSFVNAAMILSDMGPLSPIVTSSGKLFAACYALFSGLAFVVIITVIFAPVVHRFLHKFHVADVD